MSPPPPPPPPPRQLNYIFRIIDIMAGDESPLAEPSPLESFSDKFPHVPTLTVTISQKRFKLFTFFQRRNVACTVLLRSYFFLEIREVWPVIIHLALQCLCYFDVEFSKHHGIKLQIV